MATVAPEVLAKLKAFAAEQDLPLARAADQLLRRGLAAIDIKPPLTAA